MKRWVKALVLSVVTAGGSAQSEPPVLVMFGDSLVQGYGLYPEEGLVPQLAQRLQSRGLAVTVRNAGVSGDTSAGGVARLDWTLTPDVDGVVVLFGGNDLLRGIFPEETRSNLDAVLQGLRERALPTLLIGHEVPENYGAEYKEAFERLYADLAANHDVLFYPRFFDALDTGDDRTAARLAYLQDDLLHPNAAGVALIADDLLPSVVQLLDQM